MSQQEYEVGAKLWMATIWVSCWAHALKMGPSGTWKTAETRSATAAAGSVASWYFALIRDTLYTQETVSAAT